MSFTVMVRSGKTGKIAVFGGTFNPIHYGHLINTELMREYFDFDRVIFIPSKNPVHKTVSGRVRPEDRFEMARLAVSGNDYFCVSDLEIKRESPSYTITTLEELETLYPGDELFLIVGSDSFNELDTWKEYKKILAEYAMVVIQRRTDPELRADLLSLAFSVELFTGAMIDISSSMIRERVRNRNSIRYLTADSVIDFISSKGLYQIEQ